MDLWSGDHTVDCHHAAWNAIDGHALVLETISRVATRLSARSTSTLKIKFAVNDGNLFENFYSQSHSSVQFKIKLEVARPWGGILARPEALFTIKKFNSEARACIRHGFDSLRFCQTEAQQQSEKYCRDHFVKMPKTKLKVNSTTEDCPKVAKLL